MYLSSYTLQVFYVCIIMSPWVPTDGSIKKHTNTTPNFSINSYSNLYSTHSFTSHSHNKYYHLSMCTYDKIQTHQNRLHIHHHRKLSNIFPGILESLTTQPWENFVIENDSKMRIAAVRLSKNEYVPKNKKNIAIPYRNIVWVLWRNRYRWRAFTEFSQLGATRGTDKTLLYV